MSVESPATSSEITDKDPPRLDVDASVIRQLGDELITDPEQALLELIKNAYDADSSECSINIDTTYTEDLIFSDYDARRLYKPSIEDELESTKTVSRIVHGRIVIKDKGCGMDENTLRRGWLVISLSPKKLLKQQGQRTLKYQREYQGDKGLGRLGTMRLGSLIRITTHHDPAQPGQELYFSWHRFEAGIPLGKVPISLRPVPATGATGTTIEIRDLTDISYWQGIERRRSLGAKISSLISPFKNFSNFHVPLNLEGNGIDLSKLSEQTLESALSKFTFREELGGGVEMKGWVKLDIFRVSPKDVPFIKTVESDSGAALFKALSKNKFLADRKLCKALDGWYVEWEEKFKSSDFPLTDESSGLVAEDPGSFDGTLYGFNFRRSAKNIAATESDPLDLAKNFVGVSVFRDGFRIRLGGDWMGLGAEWTSGRSFYGVRPGSTIGYFNILSSLNPGLLEKTDREGFVDNASWRGFMVRVTRFLKFINDALNALRRTYLLFQTPKTQVSDAEDLELEEPAIVDPHADIESKRLLELSRVALGVRQRFDEITTRRQNTLQMAKASTDSLLKTPNLPSGVRTIAQELQGRFDEMSGALQSGSGEVRTLLNEVAGSDNLLQTIAQRSQRLDEQVLDLYDHVALGISAQGLVHEAGPIIDETLAALKSTRDRLRQKAALDSTLAGNLQTIRSNVALLGKQMAFLNPMVRAHREEKQEVSLLAFLKDFRELRLTRLQTKSVDFIVDNRAERDMRVRMNRARLAQVFDNLTRNSEYWLGRFREQAHSAVLAIHVDFESPVVSFYDTGYGVRESYENTLFDLFSSDRPNGQGLGLFITAQILQSQNCSIRLSSERNVHGRRFKFLIDFAGVLTDENRA